ncbi:3-deoxy-manno-octulosonate-8-phosphatase KdsC [Marinicella gelatinilytica]|uniref:3-deoxy-manno-octulosonate-8-phosphatase KdsC n=1 Tax=Marinicella gelatinilytica TaxID=2996017 RepID=UPI002260BB26|nr:3-deoxy-manno-octulosonate-8-phosphatase KdsC [Marinicella gelatinilytica]MCX7544601.1 3-deoxy-manno-octulosonate-8-phosphatase KdsC [Marinicella gelatinilytica]
MTSQLTDEIIAKAKNIQLVIFDVDGVLTDGGLYFTDDGREMKKFNVKDGLGISLLIKHNIEVAVITGRNSVIVADRMRSLGVNHVYQGRLNKLETYENLKAALRIEDQHVAFVGDDVIDIPIMDRCGLPVAVADAHDSVLDKACWVTSKKGGEGAARQVCDVLLCSHDIKVNGYEFSGQQ